MHNEELFKEIDTSVCITEEYFGLSLGRFLFLFTIVIFFGIYLGIIFYGTNSLEVLLGLEEYENFLQNEVVKLRDENAELQREYFELKEISAE